MTVIAREDLLRVQKKIKNYEYYNNNSKAINSYIQEHSTNDKIEDVIVKVMLIDSANSTDLKKQKNKVNFYEIAKTINETKDIDIRLKEGDISLVEEIIEAINKKVFNKTKSKLRLISFVSKYCQIHNSVVYNRDDFVKYDNVVNNNLYQYTKSKVVKTRLKKNFNDYYNKIDEVIKEQNLENEPKIREKIDHYIWWNNK